MSTSFAPSSLMQVTEATELYAFTGVVHAPILPELRYDLHNHDDPDVHLIGISHATTYGPVWTRTQILKLVELMRTHVNKYYYIHKGINEFLAGQEGALVRSRDDVRNKVGDIYFVFFGYGYGGLTGFPDWNP